MKLQLKPGYKLREQAPEDHDNPCASAEVRMPNGTLVCEYYEVSGSLYVWDLTDLQPVCVGEYVPHKDWHAAAHAAFSDGRRTSPWEEVP